MFVVCAFLKKITKYMIQNYKSDKYKVFLMFSLSDPYYNINKPRSLMTATTSTALMSK